MGKSWGTAVFPDPDVIHGTFGMGYLAKPQPNLWSCHVRVGSQLSHAKRWTGSTLQQTTTCSFWLGRGRQSAQWRQQLGMGSPLRQLLGFK